MSKNKLLSKEEAAARYAEERRQGESLLSEATVDAAWGWSGPAGVIRAERRTKFIIKQAGLKPGTSALELGCGTGEFTTRLLKSGCNLSAIELSEATAAVCKKRVDGKANVFVGNIETGEGLEGKQFDAIVGVSVLHHVNMDLCLKNTFSHLKPGGHFAFSEPNMLNPQIWAERKIEFIRKWRHVTEHETAFRTGELRRIFTDAGFVVDICEPFEFMHPSTPGLLIAPVKLMETILQHTPLLSKIAGSIRIAGHRPAK